MPPFNLVATYAAGSTATIGPVSRRSRAQLWVLLSCSTAAACTIASFSQSIGEISVDPTRDPTGVSVTNTSTFLARFFYTPYDVGSNPSTLTFHHNGVNTPYTFNLVASGIELPAPDGDPAVLVNLLSPPASNQRVFVRSRITRADGRLAIPYQHRLDALPHPPWYSNPIAGESPRFHPPGSAGGCRLTIKMLGDTRAAIFGSPAVWWINDTPNAPVSRPNYFRGTALSSTTYVPGDGTFYEIAMADSGIVAPVLPMGIFPQMVYLPRTIDQAFRLTGYRPLSPRAQNASTE